MERSPFNVEQTPQTVIVKIFKLLLLMIPSSFAMAKETLLGRRGFKHGLNIKIPGALKVSI